MKKEIGEKQLLILIGFGGLALTLGFCSMSGAGVTTGSTTFNSCMGHSEVFEVKLTFQSVKSR